MPSGKTPCPPDIEVDRPLRPEYREPGDQQHQEDRNGDVEQEAGDIGRSRRNAGEAEKACDDRHQKENQRPFENLSLGAPGPPDHANGGRLIQIHLT